MVLYLFKFLNAIRVADVTFDDHVLIQDHIPWVWKNEAIIRMIMSQIRSYCCPSMIYNQKQLIAPQTITEKGNLVLSAKTESSQSPQ